MTVAEIITAAGRKKLHGNPGDYSQRIQMCVFVDMRGACGATIETLPRTESQTILAAFETHLYQAHLQTLDREQVKVLLSGTSQCVGHNKGDTFARAYVYLLSNGRQWMFGGTLAQAQLWAEHSKPPN